MTIECTLEEFFFGCKKSICFERIVLLGDERSEKFTVISRDLEVKPGMGPWTELRLVGEGHERFGLEKSDLVIKFKEVFHPLFKRQGDDLIYLHKISLLDSLLSTPVHFTTLDNEKIEISIDSVISP